VRNTLHSGGWIETLERYSNDTTTQSASFWVDPYYDDFVRVIYPTAGFVSMTTNQNQIEFDHYLYDVTEENHWIPLYYQGWWPDQDYKGWVPVFDQQYLYAPTYLVIAQNLWNATQVFQIFLLLALLYDCYYNAAEHNNNNSDGARPFKNILVWSLVVSSLILLPFSVYVISLGGYLFAGATVLTTALALLRKSDRILKVTVEEDNACCHKRMDSPCTQGNEEEEDEDTVIEKDMFGNYSAWMVIREETVACLANLFSHMYNGREPWWTICYFVDNLFGFQNGGDGTPKAAFTMGQPNVRIPLFVSQSNYSTTYQCVFLLLWSILPFLYVSYFGIMYLVAPQSPGLTVQRALCVFGILNFLFVTDVVAYYYGRGYRNPYEDVFHWWEHFAWRIAILLPIYQNCTNRHWEHPNYPLAGKILRITAASYGIFFFVFQVIQCDMFRFVTFLIRGEEQSLFELVGWDEHPIVTVLNLNTPKTWATMGMAIFYFALHFSSFPLFQIILRRENGVLLYERLPTSTAGLDNVKR